MRQLATHVRSGGRIQDSGASRQSWARRFAKEATHAAERWLARGGEEISFSRIDK